MKEIPKITRALGRHTGNTHREGHANQPTLVMKLRSGNSDACSEPQPDDPTITPTPVHRAASQDPANNVLIKGVHYATYAAVRQHERRAHAEGYQTEVEKRLPVPETEKLSAIAAVEARCGRGLINLHLVEEATGLTQHQIWYRRRKPEYQQFLELAIRELREVTTEPEQSPPKRTQHRAY